MTHLLGVARHPLEGSASRYRYYQYLPALERAGIRATTATLFDSEYLRRLYARQRQSPSAIVSAYARLAAALRKARDVDVVFLEKEAFPYLPYLVERVLHPRGIPFVLDLDDAVFHRYDRAPARLTRALLSSKLPRLVSKAAAVTAGSPYLADFAARHGATRVERIPTVVDLERYHPPERAPRDGPITVGWIGAPVTSHYLHQIREPLAHFCAKTGSRLRTIGAGSLTLDGVPTEALAWTLEGEVAALSGIDVGIMPLPDDPWERGKCGLKLIQYMALGIPVVASPVGANLEIVQHGREGFLAAGADDWMDALMALHDSPTLRARMGHAGRGRVARDYALDVTAPRLASILKEAAHAA